MNDNGAIWRNSRYIPGTRSSQIRTADDLYIMACEYFEFMDSTTLESHNEKRTSIKTDKKGKLVEKSNDAKTVESRRPYQVRGFCAFSGLNYNYFNRLKERMFERIERQDTSEDEKARCLGIIECWEWVQDCIYNQKIEGGMAGLFDPRLVARDLGLQELRQTDLTNSDGSLKPAITVRDQKTADNLNSLVDKLSNNNRARID